MTSSSLGGTTGGGGGEVKWCSFTLCRGVSEGCHSTLYACGISYNKIIVSIK